LPAIRSTINPLLAAALRKPDAVIDPSGKANVAATPSRTGVFEPICSLGGETAALVRDVMTISYSLWLFVAPPFEP
jgi:hypothetical protein